MGGRSCRSRKSINFCQNLLALQILRGNFARIADEALDDIVFAVNVAKIARTACCREV
jgi:hypothetical protein